ncbi:MAG TPA: hypothetical protein VK659_09890, partial [Asanoa sp.]|nr:hypothetical protein [Asanoa sp.]
VACELGDFGDHDLLDRTGQLRHSLVKATDDRRRRPSGDHGVVMARFRHDQTINLQISAPSCSLRPFLAPQASNSPKLRRLGTSRHPARVNDPERNQNQSSASAEKVSRQMSSYFSAIAVLLLVLSPLFIPIAVTVAPLASSGVRRVARAFGLNSPAPRLA